MHLIFQIQTKLPFKQFSPQPLFKNPFEILLLIIERTMNHLKLVIIPTFNELENIREMVETVMGLDGDFSLLIIDDGSPDGTAEVVKSLQITYPERLQLLERKGKLGLGTAYITQRPDSTL
jgi:dolichol-phosphate mannosyltransferase